MTSAKGGDDSATTRISGSRDDITSSTSFIGKRGTT
jgi:hypothetical protein